MSRPTATALDRIMALGEKASRYTEAELARAIGASRERIRQLKAGLPFKPINSRQAFVPGYTGPYERAFYAVMRAGIDKLVALVDARGDDECWPWLGFSDRGYGILGPNCRYVHRLICERELGPLPREVRIRHTLGGPPCCNPRHLLLAMGPRKAHRVLRRAYRVKASVEPGRLTIDQVRTLRRAYARLPRVTVRREGRMLEQVPIERTKALAGRFGMKTEELLAYVATWKSGSARGSSGTQ